MKHDQNRGKENGVLFTFGQPFEILGFREIPEVNGSLEIVISFLEIDREVLDDEWNCKVQPLSEKVPEQHADVIPLESSEHNFEQNVSGLLRYDGVGPFLLKLWERSLKLLPISKVSILYWR